MKSDYKEQYRLAREKFDDGSYEDTLNILIELVNELLREPSQDSIIIDSIQLAIASYQNIDPEGEEEILKNNIGIPLEQYFAIVRRYQDRKEEKNESWIQREIYRPHLLDVSELREITTKEKHPEPKIFQIGPYKAAVVSSQGPRDTMEDEYLLDEIEYNENEKIPFFCVLDGHGGYDCVAYIKEHLKEELQNEIKNIKESNDLSIYNAMCRTFLNLNDRWKSIAFQTESWSGSTAILAMIIKNKELWIANLGDSRAVLSQNNRAVQLSEDAKAAKEKYQKEIHSRGGYILYNRVDGNLSMTRAIGDLRHPSISSRPQIRKFILNSEDKNILILASDGLWDVIGSEQAAKFTIDKSISEAVEDMQTTAYAFGSWDNITIIAVDLNGQWT